MTANILEVAVDKIVFREDLYPRIQTNPTTVQTYASDLSVLPPIEVNQDYALIDGWHRWTAHRKAEAKTIHVIITKTASDAELLEFAIERNAAHGLQLSPADKQDMARKLYAGTPLKEQEDKKKRLAKILSVSLRVVQSWLSRIDNDFKESRDNHIFDLWLACHTHEEIAAAVGCSSDVVNAVCRENEKLRLDGKPAALHQTDFEVPLYNVWTQQQRNTGSDHFGNSETRWVDNLLYLYTKPFDIVIDPFAGGGSTIDLCKKRLRRYWVGDRKPIVEREKEIREHDLVTAGLPDLKGRWGDVKLVYLDPPYWKQAEGKYSKDKSDLANMTLEAFNEALTTIIKGFAKKLKDSKQSYIALIIQPTQWNAPDRVFTDHVVDMLRAIDLPVETRISVPYESQQCTAQMVEWAKKEKKFLVLTREIVVWIAG